MKFLKYLLFAILALVIVFFVAGLLRPSITYYSEIEVDHPPAKCWEVMSDTTKLADWLTGYQRSELLSGTANTPGAVSNIYFNNNGQEMVIKETMKEIRPNELMAMDFETDFMNMEYKFMFEDMGGKTKISSETISRGNGVFARSMVAFLKGTMQGQEDENMAKLKAVIER